MITGVGDEHEKEVLETLFTLVQKGIVVITQIHMIDEKELEN